jgi:hypothetical protein
VLIALGGELFERGVERVHVATVEARITRGISVDKWFSFLSLPLRLHRAECIPL